MKITLITLAGAGENPTIELDTTANIREFKTKAAEALGKNDPDMFCFLKLVTANEQSLGAIYRDDPSDENFVNFFETHKGYKISESDELKFYITYNFGTGFYRKTPHNPKGYSLDVARIEHPDNKFFKFSDEVENSFTERALSLSIPIEEIREEFLDPITMDLMNDPVIASDGHTYDRKSLLELLSENGGVSPFTREKCFIKAHNLRIKALIEDFLSVKENAVVKADDIDVKVSPKFETLHDNDVQISPVPLANKQPENKNEIYKKIQKALINYTGHANNKILGSLHRFFHGHWNRHHSIKIFALLTDNKYKGKDFNQDLFEKFFKQLAQQIDLQSINPNGDLATILKLAQDELNVDIYQEPSLAR